MEPTAQLLQKEKDFLECSSKGDYIKFCENYYDGLSIDVAIDSKYRKKANDCGIDLRNYCTFYFEGYSIGKVINVLEYSCILLMDKNI